jgi:uncharacterized membrane protein YhhN
MVAWAVERAGHGAGAPTAASAAWLLPGFALHALGDALLLGTGRWFLAGLGAFLLGHVAYAATFAELATRVAPDAPPTPALLTLAAMGAAIAALLAWMGPRLGRMRAPVIAYMVTISVMVAAAVQASAALAQPWLAVAAVAFALSDVLVARNRFVAPSPWNRYVGLPMYYVAQAMFGAQLAG